MTQPKRKHSHCLRCEKEFDKEVKLRSRGYCIKCYYFINYVEKRKEGDISNNIIYDEKGNRLKTDTCLTCNIKFGELNKKGKVVKPHTSQYCRNCYMKQYKRTGKLCKVCGEEILNRTAKPVCKRCYIPIKDLMKSEEARKKSREIKTTNELLEKVRLTIVRYKHGNYTSLDHFKLIDLYIDVMGDASVANGKAYDSMEMEDQIIYILKDLKLIYDKNKAMS